MTDLDAIEYLQELKEFNVQNQFITPKNKTLGYDTIYQCVFERAIRALKEQMSINDNWIYCGNGQNLPAKDGFYLVSLSEQIHHGDDALAIQKCWFNEKTRAFLNYGKFVIAWQPLPRKYEECVD